MTNRLLIRLVVAGALMAAAHGALIGVLPVYLDDHSVAPILVGVIVGSYAIAMAAMRPVAGRMFGRYEPRQLLVVSGVLMSVAFAGYLVIGPNAGLLAPRLVHGAAWGLLSTAAFAWIASTSERSDTGRRMGVYGMGTGIALVLAPAIGLAIYNGTNVRVVLLTGIALSITLVLFVSRMPGAERRVHAVATGDARVASTRIYAVIFLASATTGLLEAFLPALARERGVGARAVVYVCFGVALGAGRVLGGTASDRMGRVRVASGGLIGVAFSFVLMQTVHGTVQMSAVAVVYGLAIGGTMMALTADVSDRAVGEQQSRALGMAALLSDVGLAAGAGGGGALAARSISTVNAGGVALGLAALAVLASEHFNRRTVTDPVLAGGS